MSEASNENRRKRRSIVLILLFALLLFLAYLIRTRGSGNPQVGIHYNGEPLDLYEDSSISFEVDFIGIDLETVAFRNDPSYIKTIKSGKYSITYDDLPIHLQRDTLFSINIDGDILAASGSVEEPKRVSAQVEIQVIKLSERVEDPTPSLGTDGSRRESSKEDSTETTDLASDRICHYVIDVTSAAYANEFTTFSYTVSAEDACRILSPTEILWEADGRILELRGNSISYSFKDSGPETVRLLDGKMNPVGSLSINVLPERKLKKKVSCSYKINDGKKRISIPINQTLSFFALSTEIAGGCLPEEDFAWEVDGNRYESDKFDYQSNKIGPRKLTLLINLIQYEDVDILVHYDRAYLQSQVDNLVDIYQTTNPSSSTSLKQLTALRNLVDNEGVQVLISPGKRRMSFIEYIENIYSISTTSAGKYKINIDKVDFNDRTGKLKRVWVTQKRT